jgi:hypothetical protein
MLPSLVAALLAGDDFVRAARLTPGQRRSALEGLRCTPGRKRWHA